MNRDTLSITFNFINYRDLYSTSQVNQLWHQASQIRLKIWQQSDPILPILHNRLIHDDFIDSLYELYNNYIIQTNIDFHRFLTNMNSSYNTGYDNNKFTTIFNQSDKIDPLFRYIIQHLPVKYNLSNIPIHTIEIYIHDVSLFEKGFMILTYFKSLLNIVYFRDFRDFDQFIYSETTNYSIRWNIRLFQSKIFDK